MPVHLKPENERTTTVETGIRDLASIRARLENLEVRL